MRFEQSTCPECGGPPGAIEETMLVEQAIAFDEETDTWEYTGDYQDHAETLEPALDTEGRRTLLCSRDSLHTWPTHVAAEV